MHARLLAFGANVPAAQGKAMTWECVLGKRAWWPCESGGEKNPGTIPAVKAKLASAPAIISPIPPRPGTATGDSREFWSPRPS